MKKKEQFARNSKSSNIVYSQESEYYLSTMKVIQQLPSHTMTVSYYGIGLPFDQMSLGRQLSSQFSCFRKETKVRPGDYATSFSDPALARIFVPLMRRANCFLFPSTYLPSMPFNFKFNRLRCLLTLNETPQ